MAYKGYQGYRGRSSGLKTVLVILLILILLLACAFLFLQHYIIYTDDGGIRLDLPSFSERTDDPPQKSEPAVEPDVQLHIDGIVQPKPVEDAAPPVQKDVKVRKLAELEQLPADGAALRASLEAAGANGFVYTVKNHAGQVYYGSEVALRDAVAVGSADRAALEALCGDEEVISVARLNCFHDSYYAWTHMEEAGVCQSTGYIWYDFISYFWLDPDKEDARDYVIALALECAQMGFDELLLEEMCYPTKGKLEKIDYSGNTLSKSDALVLFLQELRAALSSYEIEISLLLPEEVLFNGGDEISGQDLSKLLPMVDAVYAAVEDPASVRSVLAMYGGDEVPDFVPMAEQPAAEGNWYTVDP